MFYDNQESKREIVYEYLSKGFFQGKGLLYVFTEEKPEQISSWLIKKGIDFDLNLKSGNILIPRYDEWYFEGGYPETIRALRKIRETNSYFKEKGLGMRAVGELSCFFREGEVKELLRYEYALHKVLDIEIEAFCVFDIKTIVETGYTEIIMPLVRAHGKAIFASQNGTIVMEPEKVEDKDVEKLLEIKI
jgi:hypothetical protein